MKKILKIVGINVMILVAMLAILEIILRIFNIGYGNEPLEQDHVLHHKHPANYIFKSYSPSKEYGGHYVKYDSIGNRVDEKNSKKADSTIWFLGDSFTAAIQVSWENTFVGRTESLSKHKYTGINFGVSSYSPIMYVILLKKYLEILPKPKMVFVQLYSNDVSGDNEYQGDSKFNLKDEPVSIDGGETNFLTRFLRKLYIARTFRKMQLTWQYSRKKEKNPEQHGELRLNNYVEEAPVIDSGCRFAKSVLQIHAILEGAKIPHYFFAIPSKYSSFSGNWGVKSFSQEFIKFATSNRLPLISLDDRFKEASKSEKLFFEEDIHCNEKGNTIIAEEIFKTVAKQIY